MTPRTVGVYMNAIHNPTGRVLPAKFVDELVRVVKRHDLVPRSPLLGLLLLLLFVFGCRAVLGGAAFLVVRVLRADDDVHV